MTFHFEAKNDFSHGGQGWLAFHFAWTGLASGVSPSVDMKYAPDGLVLQAGISGEQAWAPYAIQVS